MAAARRNRARRTSELKAGRPAQVSSADASTRVCWLQETVLSAADMAEITGVAVTFYGACSARQENGLPAFTGPRQTRSLVFP